MLFQYGFCIENNMYDSVSTTSHMNILMSEQDESALQRKVAILKDSGMKIPRIFLTKDEQTGVVTFPVQSLAIATLVVADDNDLHLLEARYHHPCAASTYSARRLAEKRSSDIQASLWNVLVGIINNGSRDNKVIFSELHQVRLYSLLVWLIQDK